MSETLLGIIIGGAIGLIPTLTTCILDFRKERMRQRHELRMKKLELYETDRMHALKQYCAALGACLDINTNQYDDESFDKMKSDYNKAFNSVSLFVSRTTYEAMLKVCEPWDKMITEPEIVHLNRCLHAEMESAFENLQ